MRGAQTGERPVLYTRQTPTTAKAGVHSRVNAGIIVISFLTSCAGEQGGFKHGASGRQA